MDPDVSLYLLLGLVLVNVVCWGIVLLRIIQNLDTSAAKVVLALHLLGIAPGVIAAFVYGWVRRDLNPQSVMLVWSVAIAAMILLGVAESFDTPA